MVIREVIPEIILQVVAEEFNISASDLTTRKQHKGNHHTSTARQCIAYLLKLYTDVTLEEIAQKLGFTDKQYARFAIDKAIETSTVDLAFRKWLLKAQIMIIEKHELYAASPDRVMRKCHVGEFQSRIPFE